MTDTEHRTAERIGNYVVEELLGHGGMGEVYKARDERLDRFVALKILAPRFAEDTEFRERLLRESRLAASLDHPNVVPVYDAGEQDGQLFLAMRYVEGTDLKALLRREGVLEPAPAVEIVQQVAAALDVAHERGLVHRDVKPSNVLIDERGHCYLADFGLTQSVSDRGPTDGQLVGTVDYAAPEQIRGDEVDGRADVYSLGCLVFECLTGTLPFSGQSDVAIVFAHLQEEPARASERVSALPAAIDEVLGRAMAKNPAYRQSSCGELVSEARGALGLSGRPASRRRIVGAFVLVASLVLAALATALMLRGAPAAATSGGELVRIDGATPSVRAVYPVAASPTHVIGERGQVWFSAADTVWRFDPAIETPVRIESVGYVHDLAALDGRVYVARDGESLAEGLVVPYDAVGGSRFDGLSILACSLTAGADLGLWVAGCPNVQRISIEPARLAIAQTVVLPFRQPLTAGTSRNCLCSMTTGDGSVWVAGDAADPRVWRIARDGTIEATIRLSVAPRAVAYSSGSLWVTAPLDDAVLEIDADSNRVVRRIPVGRAPAGIAAGPNGVWVAQYLDRTVGRIDPDTRRLVETVAVDGHPFELAVMGAEVWVTSDGS